VVAWIDSVVSTLIRWGMLGVVYLISLIVLLMEIVGNIYMIFEEEFSIGAIDTLEFLGIGAFFVISIRFWNKGLEFGLTKIRRVYEYSKVVIFLGLVEIFVFSSYLIFLISENDSISESDIAMNMPAELPAFWLLSLVLYAFSPRKKVMKSESKSLYDNESKIDETNSKAEVL
jgi:hypothetical protein